jgi:hypothetical protein
MFKDNGQSPPSLYILASCKSDRGEWRRLMHVPWKGKKMKMTAIKNQVHHHDSTHMIVIASSIKS